jgi:hypothetical protein
MSKNKCNENDIFKRGGANPQNSEYANTVADYTNLATGDNIIENMTCDATVSVGDIVRLSAGTVVKAQADTLTNSNIIGICVTKNTSTDCNVQVTGYTASVFGGLDVTKKYYLSDATAGAITANPPTASGSYVIRIGTPRSTSSIIIQVERVVKRA